MIVTCEECSTSFQLDESRIPETGARVRCSRCKHAFFLPNPSASQSEVADSIAEETAGDRLASVPTAAPDLSLSTLGAPGKSGSGISEPEEEDWQFSEEIRVEGDDDPELDTDEDPGSSGVFGTALDVEAALDDFSTNDLENSGFEESASAEPQVAEGRDESDFGSVDDFSSLMEEEDVAPVDLASGAASELQIEEAPTPSPGVYSALGTSDDLGDPESWDLVGSEGFAVSNPPPTVPIRSSGDRSSADAEDFFGSESDVVRYEEEIGPASKIRKTIAGVGRGVGWAATIIMVGAVLFFGLLGEWTRGAQREQVVSAGGLTAQTMKASWVESSRSGYVFVVEGQLRNDTADSLWPGTVQLALLDANGGRLVEEPIRAGIPVSEFVLREGAPDELVSTSLAAARRLTETPIRPGEVRPFEAIALETRLPEAASRILLEMSHPGAVANTQPEEPKAARPDASAHQEPSAD